MTNSFDPKDAEVGTRQKKVQQVSIPFALITSASPAINSTFGILGSTTVTNTGATVIHGDLGLSPGTSVTGFPPGTILGAEQVANTAAANAQIVATTAYNALQALTGATDESGNDLGTLTLTPGLYKYTSSAQLTGTLTLDAQGNPNAVWIFQIGSTLTTASASNVNIINGGSPGNVYWAVGTSATIGTTTAMAGNILAEASITLNTGATLLGSASALTGAVTLAGNIVTVVPAVTGPPSSITSDEPDLLFFQTALVNQITPELYINETATFALSPNASNSIFNVLFVVNEPVGKVIAAKLVYRDRVMQANQGVLLGSTTGITTGTAGGTKIMLTVETGSVVASLNATLEIEYTTKQKAQGLEYTPQYLEFPPGVTP